MSNIKCLFRSTLNIRGRTLNYESVRWVRPRKPFWLGMAKSKMFVLPKKWNRFNDEELAEHRRLTIKYQNQLDTILNFIKRENPLNIQGKLEASETGKHAELEKEIEESYERNEKWNAYGEKLRNERMKSMLEEYSKKVKRVIDSAERNKERERSKIEEIVRQEKITGKSFITPEKLDEAIENCLNSYVEYNFAIDLQGTKITGKETYHPPENLNLMGAKEMKERADG